MIVVMLVTLYTTRVVLNVLGETNYGIYNIIGGVVIMFAFLNNAMSNATQRYLSFALGKNDKLLYNRYYSASIISYVIISITILILAETLGLWFVNTKLTIPSERIMASNIVYQFTIITFIINLFKIPFEAVVISHEKMSFYAYLSIIDVILRLLVVFLLKILPGDKLIDYGILMMIVPLGITISFILFCKYKLNCHFVPLIDKFLLKDLFSFSGWTLLGGMANVTARQGGNILINIFFGVSVNAAVGIGNQVNAAISSLVHSFQTAFRPQIIKLYAANDTNKLNQLILRSSTWSYYLLLIMFIPLSLNIKPILALWLVDVPEYAGSFAILLMLYCMIDAIQAPLFFLIYATGQIRTYQLWLSLLLFLNVPVSFLWLKYGGNPLSIFYVYVGINLVSAIIRTIYISNLTKFPSMIYLKSVIYRCLISSVIAGITSYYISQYLNNYKYGYIGSI